MNGPGALQGGAGSRSSGRSRDEWEDWEDDEVLTPMTTRDEPLLYLGNGKTGSAMGETAASPRRQPSQRSSSLMPRQSVSKLRRLTSRQRQRAQNEKFGIKLVTDMSKFRQQQHHIAQQMRQIPENRESRTGKFVDAAALRALEGSPSDDSIGTLAWLRRRPTKGKRVEQLAAESSQADLSPSARPIVIGFAMPSDSDVVISPQTAVVETPIDFPRYFKPPTVVSPSQPVSAWSPDTEDGASPRTAERAYVPAVPSIPQHYRAADASPLTAASTRKDHRDTLTTPIYVSDDDDDMGTPVTLFEEDGSPATTRAKPLRYKGRQRSATVGSSRSQGWWDQVTSPFGPPTPQSPGASQPVVAESQSWWKEVDKKRAPPAVSPRPEEAESSTGPRNAPKQHHRPPEIIVEDVSSGLPSSSTSAAAPPQRSMTPQPEKPRGAAEEVQTPGEQPPPYSPPSSKHHNARYHAVFPADHPLASMYPPSPGPVPPGLSRTMTSQGAIGLADVPLTPPPVGSQSRLPDRPLGSFVPGDHLTQVSGRGPRQKAERRRRRHEKEDAVAWKTGRAWHGRGCFPCCGCFGRPGREGRKRRRVCLAVCAAVLLLLTALGVTLGVLLSRRGDGDAAAPPSQFLNLTGFPPIPTGIATVVGPESDAVTACVQPPTLWTCALPKEEADSAAPFRADQPGFVIQIQYDSDPRELWNVAGDPPRPAATPTARARDIPVAGFTSLVRRALLRARNGAGLNPAVRPDPPPPSVQEMFFLGDTTDGVISDAKAGEPTPFYISILRSVNDTVGPSKLTRRQRGGDDDDDDSDNSAGAPGRVLNASDIAPPPALLPDGTGAPAVLLPFPAQQPLRLYDRGLSTERYGFYTYFNKTTYVKSVDALTGNGPGGDSSPVPADRDGGSLRTEANFLVTWLSVRYKVEIWTRMTDGSAGDDATAAATARLTGGFGGRASDGNGTQPGTFPYPVTVTLDTHGGPRGGKFVFVRGVDDRQRIVLDDARFVANRMNTTGDLVNPAGDFDPSLGGMDGGTGGCRCEYRNWVGVNGRVE